MHYYDHKRCFFTLGWIWHEPELGFPSLWAQKATGRYSCYLSDQIVFISRFSKALLLSPVFSVPLRSLKVTTRDSRAVPGHNQKTQTRQRKYLIHNSWIWQSHNLCIWTCQSWRCFDLSEVRHDGPQAPGVCECGRGWSRPHHMIPMFIPAAS